jgi:hypothetical protein
MRQPSSCFRGQLCKAWRRLQESRCDVVQRGVWYTQFVGAARCCAGPESMHCVSLAAGAAQQIMQEVLHGQARMQVPCGALSGANLKIAHPCFRARARACIQANMKSETIILKLLAAAAAAAASASAEQAAPITRAARSVGAALSPPLVGDGSDGTAEVVSSSSSSSNGGPHAVMAPFLRLQAARHSVMLAEFEK